MKRTPSKNPERKKQQRIALERIQILLSLAHSEKREHPERSKRYVKLALKISEKYNARLTREQKLSFCKKCNSYYTSENSKTRVNPKTKSLEKTCLECKHVKRVKVKDLKRT